jgi:phospholipid-translocating ATPase
LKPRKALKATMGISNEEDIEHAQFWIDSEPPHASRDRYFNTALYEYKLACGGSLSIQNCACSMSSSLLIHANLYSYSAVLKYRSREEKLGMEHPIIEGKERQGGRTDPGSS